MAILVGRDDSVNTATFARQNNMYSNFDGQRVKASGTATTAYVYVTDWRGATGLKVSVRASASDCLGATDEIPSSEGTGWISASINLSRDLANNEFVILEATHTPGLGSNQSVIIGCVAKGADEQCGGTYCISAVLADATAYTDLCSFTPTYAGQASSANVQMIYLTDEGAISSSVPVLSTANKVLK